MTFLLLTVTRFKAQRLKEMQSQIPTFGYVRKIDQSEFVDTIDNERPSVFVVIHLYQDVNLSYCSPLIL